MAIQVKIPTMLLKYTGQKSLISVRAKTVSEMIDRLDEKCPGTKDLILSTDGTINHHFLICINEEDVRYLDGLGSALSPNDHVEIVASIAGGAFSTPKTLSGEKLFGRRPTLAFLFLADYT